MTERQAKYLMHRISRIAERVGLGNVDDVVQETMLRILEGKHQKSTIAQALVDYRRRNFGHTRQGRTKNRRLREAFNQPCEFDDEMNGHYDAAYLDARLDLPKYLARMDEREALCFVLYHVWGYNLEEVGERIGVCDSRVSQILKGY